MEEIQSKNYINQEENNELFIKISKTNIDELLYNYNYSSAFKLLIMVLERLDYEAKIEFIDYYSKKLGNLIF